MDEEIKRIEYKDSMGRWITQGLFADMSFSDFRKKFKPVFTLKSYKEGYRFMKEEYLEAGDPTEYSFAINTLGSWEHWKHLCSSKWFQEHVECWREELELKLRSQGIKKMVELAKTKGPIASSAAKYLSDKGWDIKRGRPSKEEIDRNSKMDAKIKSKVSRDLEIIRNNGKL